MEDMVAAAHAVVDDAIREAITDQDRELAGIVVLYSGGNDSTTLAHMFRDRADYAAHANTGIGIEQTRQFVRDTCEAWGLPLLERHPPTSYRDLVLERGFPGPGQHFKMYQRLKERCIEQVRNEIIAGRSRTHRVVFLAGRRRAESARRSTLASTWDRKGSAVFVSPLLDWTALDLNAYRRVYPDVPRNEVSDILHMSGECLCGAFAHRGELDEIGEWYPHVKAEINALEVEVAAAGIPAQRCVWGWGADRKPSRKTGLMCSTCEYRQESLFLTEDDLIDAIQIALAMPQ